MSDAGDHKLPRAGGLRERITAWIWASDLRLITIAMVAIYAGFLLASVLLGLSLNGTVNTLQRITFLVAVYAIMALALNLHWGYTGLFNIGIAGFMAVGVYTMAMLTGPVNPRPEEVPGLGLPLWIGVVGGVLAAALVGVVVAFPALRLRADYLAIVTIAFSEIIRITYLSTTFQRFTVAGIPLGTGGGQGINLPTNPVRVLYYREAANPGAGTTGFGDTVFAMAGTVGIQPTVVIGWSYALVLVAFVGLFYLLLVRIGNSPFGRVLKAIREDELVANSLGKDVNWFKIKVFAVGCGLMGLGGILWQGSQSYVNPGDFTPLLTFYIFVALIIGGAGSNTGSIVGGAMFAALLFEGPVFVGRLVSQYIVLGSSPAHFVAALAEGPLGVFAYAIDNISTLRFVLIGGVLVYLMQNRPDGLLGHRKEVASSVDLSERPPSPDAQPAADGAGGESDEQ